MTSPYGPPPDYLSLAIERLMWRLLERGVDAEAGNTEILRRLDKIMADQTQFAAQLDQLTAVVQGFSDLANDVHGATTVPDQASLDAARAEGEQSGFDQATAQLAQGVADAQAQLDALRAQFADLTAPAPVDSTPVDAPVDPAPVDAPPVDEPAPVDPGFPLGNPGA